MKTKHTPHPHTPSPSSTKQDSCAPSVVSRLASFALCVIRRLTCSYINRQIFLASSSAGTAPGSKNFTPSTQSSKTPPDEKTNTTAQTTSTTFSTKQSEKSLLQGLRLTMGLPVYPDKSDALEDNPWPPSVKITPEIYGTTGRWCPHCRQYKSFAILKRYGNKASNVQYVPLCPSCGAILLTDNVSYTPN